MTMTTRPLLLTTTLVTVLLACGGCNSPAERAAIAPPVTPPPTVFGPAPTTAPTTTPTTRAASQPTTAPVVVAPPSVVDPRETLPFLASDALGGRMPGTPELRRAGDYLADKFARIGLAPLAGHADDFQPFTMSLSVTLGPSTALVVNDKPMVVGRDFDPMSLSAEGRFDGGVAFAGYGITHAVNGHADYDDYAGLDVRGRIVLAMMKEPLNDRNASRFAAANQTWSDNAHFAEKARLAATHGAVALLLVSPPTSGGADAVNPYFAESGGAPSSTIPVVQVTRRAADLLLTMGRLHDLKSLQDQINASFAPASGVLPDVRVAGTVAVARSNADVRNVMAVLPGTGPHADEWVVVGAHYDHLGKGQMGHMFGPVGSIYHGADDNASGTAAVLELAERLHAGPPLPRSVLFVLFTGEEEGLIGSDYFVKHPPVPLEKTVAMFNMDMVGRLRDDNLLIGGAATAPIFDGMVSAAVAGTGLHTSTFERGGLGPSDHMSFALHHVPVLFLFTGLHADYHRPTDTADKINYAGLDQIVTVGERIVRAMAAMPPQQYNDREDSHSTMALATGHGSGAGQASLGVIPDYGAADARAGVLISGVGATSPAATAGLAGGDRLVGFKGKALNNLQDLSDALAQSKPGDKADVDVVRDGKRVTLHAVLGERKLSQ